MSFRAYLIIMTLATIGAWISWLVVLVSIDPTKAGGLALVFFFLTLSMALLGTLSLAGTGLRIWFKRDVLISHHVSKSFRHGLLLSILIVGSLLLLGFGFFRWWTILLLIFFITLVEMAFLTLKHNYHY